MRVAFPTTYDRADLLMSAGCSTFVAASLIMVLPRVGTVLVEILLGMFLIGCAIVARARFKRKAQSKAGLARVDLSRRKWLDRYDLLALVAVVAFQSVLDGLLRRFGWSEGARRVFPLVLLGFAILLKPRLMESVHRWGKSKDVGCSTVGTERTATPASSGPGESQSEVSVGRAGLEERK